MVTIDINKQVGVSFLLYPDNQPHVNICGVSEGQDVRVICSITNCLSLFHLLQVSNAIDNLFARKSVLIIPYLMAARYDRQMIPGSGESFDLKIVSDLINSLGFERVYLYDVHSEVSLALIKNSVNVENRVLVSEYKSENAVLIIPDAGASKKAEKYIKWNENITETVQCIKTRDLSNGKLTLTVLEPWKCENRNCVIIDDLCDGGGTFLAIASQINPSHLSLIVTHGVFSKGTKIFEGVFNEIITSDSYCHTYDSTIVKTIPLCLTNI